MKALMMAPLWLLLATCSVLTPWHSHAQQAEEKPAPVAAFIWLDSVPSGAEVIFRGKKAGTTPLFVDGLDEGQHTIRLVKKGYEPFDKTCNVPNDGNKVTVQLKQEPGSCIIESTPSNATVYHGTQLVGRTPFAMSAEDILPGQHTFRVSKIGYKSVNVPLDVTAAEPAHAKVALLPEMGVLKIKTIPFTAELIIEQTNYGTLNQLNESTRRSAELVLPNLVAGKYRLMLQYANQPSEIETVTIEAGKETSKELFFWYPDTRVTMADGQTLDIMTIEKDKEGKRVVLTNEMKLQTLDEAMVKKNEPIPEEEAGSIVRKARILRKMHKREKNVNKTN